MSFFTAILLIKDRREQCFFKSVFILVCIYNKTDLFKYSYSDKHNVKGSDDGVMNSESLRF
jgi:hypothetical protein